MILKWHESFLALCQRIVYILEESVSLLGKNNLLFQLVKNYYYYYFNPYLRMCFHWLLERKERREGGREGRRLWGKEGERKREKRDKHPLVASRAQPQPAIKPATWACVWLEIKLATFYWMEQHSNQSSHVPRTTYF